MKLSYKMNVHRKKSFSPPRSLQGSRNVDAWEVPGKLLLPFTLLLCVLLNTAPQNSLCQLSILRFHKGVGTHVLHIAVNATCVPWGSQGTTSHTSIHRLSGALGEGSPSFSRYRMLRYSGVQGLKSSFGSLGGKTKNNSFKSYLSAPTS